MSIYTVFSISSTHKGQLPGVVRMTFEEVFCLNALQGLSPSLSLKSYKEEPTISCVLLKSKLRPREEK